MSDPEMPFVSRACQGLVRSEPGNDPAGRRTPAAAAPESPGYELAAVSAEGGFQPSELVVPEAAEESADSADKPGKPD